MLQAILRVHWCEELLSELRDFLGVLCVEKSYTEFHAENTEKDAKVAEWENLIGREFDLECGAFAEDRSDADFAAVETGEVFDDGEAEACAADLA